MYTYPAIFEPESGGFVVRVPDIPEVITEGDSIEEAEEFAADAIETVLAEYMRRKRPIPPPGKLRRKGGRTVTLSALTAAKLALYEAMRTEQLTSAALARRLGWRKSQVDRLLDLRHGSRLDQIEAALTALNRRLLVTVEAA